MQPHLPSIQYDQPEYYKVQETMSSLNLSFQVH